MDEEINVSELHRQAGKLHAELRNVVDMLPNPLTRSLAKNMVARFHELVTQLIKKVEQIENGR